MKNGLVVIQKIKLILNKQKKQQIIVDTFLWTNIFQKFKEKKKIFHLLIFRPNNRLFTEINMWLKTNFFIFSYF